MTSKQVSRHKVLGFNTPLEQQANRMNRNEENRLRGQEKVFNRMIQRSENLINNEIRLVKQTLNGIQASSGELLHSGMNHEEPSTFFMYGERLESRRYSKRVTLMRYLQEHRRRYELRELQESFKGERQGKNVQDEEFSSEDFFDSLVAKVDAEALRDEVIIGDTPLTPQGDRTLDAERLGTSFVKDDDIISMDIKSTSRERDQSTLELNEMMFSSSPPMHYLTEVKGSTSGYHLKRGVSASDGSRVVTDSDLPVFDESSVSGDSSFRNIAIDRSYKPSWTSSEYLSRKDSETHQTRSPTPKEFCPSSKSFGSSWKYEMRRHSTTSVPVRRMESAQSNSKSSKKKQTSAFFAKPTKHGQPDGHDPVLPVEAYINKQNPEEEFALLCKNDKFKFSRPTVYAPTVSSRQKALSSHVISDKKT